MSESFHTGSYYNRVVSIFEKHGRVIHKNIKTSRSLRKTLNKYAPPPHTHTHTHFLVWSPYWHGPSHKNDHLLKCAVSQSETEKYFERIIIAFIIDVSREKKDKQIGPCYFHDPSAWEKKTISCCRKWSLLNGNTLNEVKWYNFRFIRGTSTCEKR